MNKLIIVESKNKVDAIQKYIMQLQKDGILDAKDKYEVAASIGHIMELPRTWMPLGDESEWEPKKKVITGKNIVIKDLKDKAKKSDVVLIATDPDREGEAIADDLINKLSLKDKYQRVTFNEITKDKIGEAINAPFLLDESLVKAQKARMILDRLFGYSLSSWIRKKLWNTQGSMSAGRVQSPTLKLVVERELQIEGYKPKPFVKISQEFSDESVATIVLKENIVDDNKQWSLPEAAKKIKKALTGNLTVVDITTRQAKMRALTPFKQSAVYKSASSKYGMSASASKAAMNTLFEKGLISYPRTDSTRYSQTFIDAARKFIKDSFGDNYIATEIKGTLAGKQDAHEALRVTDPSMTPDKAASRIGGRAGDLNMYKLIYNHTLQSLMVPPIRESLKYTLDDAGYEFKLSSSKVIFDGYYIVSGYAAQKELPKLEKGEILKSTSISFTDEQTKPASRYSEGSLIETMEEVGIGRPSTFSTTIERLLNVKYVSKEGNALKATNKGKAAIFSLMGFYAHIINEDYTKELEEVLDEIAEGKKDYKDVLQKFWARLQKEVKDAIIKKKATEQDNTVIINVNLLKEPEHKSLAARRAGSYGFYTREYHELVKAFMKVVTIIDKDIKIDYKAFTEGSASDFSGVIILPKPPKRGPYVIHNGEAELFNKDHVHSDAIICDKCNKNAFVLRGTEKKGKPSWFYACSGFPRCKNTKSLEDEVIANKLEAMYQISSEEFEETTNKNNQ